MAESGASPSQTLPCAALRATVRIMHITAAASPASPAFALATKYHWLTQGDNSPFVALEPVSADTLKIVVSDGWDKGNPESDQIIADTAAGMLEPVVEGVKLLVVTPQGIEGTPTWYTGDENYFASSIPGVTNQVIESEYDVDGDGTVADNEVAYLFPVDTAERGAALDHILRDEYGDYPVRFSVDV